MFISGRLLSYTLGIPYCVLLLCAFSPLLPLRHFFQSAPSPLFYFYLNKEQRIDFVCMCRAGGSVSFYSNTAQINMAMIR